MARASTDVIRRVFLDDDFNFVESGPWADNIAFVELRTVAEKHSEGNFGRMSIAMTPAAAEELGRALIASAADVRGEK